MANRVQYIFLSGQFGGLASVLMLVCAVLLPRQTLADDFGSTKDIDAEFFDLGLSAGVINIENFGSEFVLGLTGTFKASEDLFLQLNYLQTDVGLSSYEEGFDIQLPADRTYTHYDLLVGYNVFQGEVFSGPDAGLSSLYIVAGVGDTEFGSDAAFTYTLGVGFQMALGRRYMLRFDYRDYLYDTSLVTGDSEEFTVDAHMSVGLSWLF